MSTDRTGRQVESIPPPPGNVFTMWIFSTNHKVVAKQFLFTALVFLVLGGLMSLAVRWQLAYPDQPMPVLGALLKSSAFFAPDGSVDPDAYLRLVTMHGTIMIFFVVVPLLVGTLGHFLIPLHVGAREMSVPLLNLFAYWLFLVSGVVLVVSFFVTGGPAQSGWTAYPVLSGLERAAPGSGTGQTLWVAALLLFALSTFLSGVNFLLTIALKRAPGMSWGRLPLVTWSHFCTGIIQAVASPVLIVGLVLMLLEKLGGSNFFVPGNLHLTAENLPVKGEGGDPVLWQHLFWFYAHPVVLLLLLPAAGIAAELIPTFARRPAFGYRGTAASFCVLTGLGFLAWGSHMFAAGLTRGTATLFMLSAAAGAVPAAVIAFNLMATLWKGSIRLTTPMLFALSVLSFFIVGGLGGLILAVAPLGLYLNATCFATAHLHYVVFGSALFAVFAAIGHWFPRIHGRTLNDFWSRVHWALTYIGFNLAFFPMFFLGEGGTPRRQATLANPDLPYLNGLQPMNEFMTWAAFLLALAQVVFLLNYLFSMFRGREAEQNPWRSNTLEWTIPADMPYYNFDEIPAVQIGPYEYGFPGAPPERDWISQIEPLPTVRNQGA